MILLLIQSSIVSDHSTFELEKSESGHIFRFSATVANLYILQDATFGIGAFANEPVDAQQGTDQESKEIESVAASNKSDTAEETTAQEEALLANAVVPDFK